MKPTLSNEQREQADRRDPTTGVITSLREARELNRRGIDRDHASKLVEAVYLRGVELGDQRAIHQAMDLAREMGFISRLVAPIIVEPWT